uniref:arginine kinase n=1 Tax=Romanomermis culicivorax TaxID=13658 RepID=A0A915HFW2_ROMCU
MVAENWKNLPNDENACLLKKTVTDKAFNKVKDLRTLSDSSLLNIMQEAVNLPNAEIGINAPDVASYDTFRSIFDPVIAKLHNGFRGAQPKSNWGDEKKLQLLVDEETKKLDKDGQFVKSYFHFQPIMNETDYYQTEFFTKKLFADNPSFASQKSDLKGQLCLFRTTNDSEINDLLGNTTFDFRNKDKRLEVASFRNHWPIGRALFVNEAKNFAVQVNNEDHLKFISVGRSLNDLQATLKRLSDGVEAVEKITPFAKHKSLGYVSASPRNLGTGLEVSLNLHLPKLGQKENLKNLCETLNLKFEKSGDDVSVKNAYKLGMTEFDTVKMVVDGAKRLIEEENNS